MTLDQATIERLASAGIQHIQITNTPSGLRILVNGQPLPSLVWDANSLDALLEILKPLEPTAITSLGNLLDAVTILGSALSCACRSRPVQSKFPSSWKVQAQTPRRRKQHSRRF